MPRDTKDASDLFPESNVRQDGPIDNGNTWPGRSIKLPYTGDPFPGQEPKTGEPWVTPPDYPTVPPDYPPIPPNYPPFPNPGYPPVPGPGTPLPPPYTPFPHDYPGSRRIPHKCPVCDGTGHVSRPPWVAGDVDTFTTTDIRMYPCRACQGSGIVWEPIG